MSKHGITLTVIILMVDTLIKSNFEIYIIYIFNINLQTGVASSFVGCMNPCDENPCEKKINSICQALNSHQYRCVCQDNLSQDKYGNCGRNCNENWLHGETNGQEECVDGQTQSFCSNNRNQGRQIIMGDSIERICDNGTMKPLNCELFYHFCFKISKF